MSRADLIAACKSAQPGSDSWLVAVQALGAASSTGFPPPKKPGRPTGLSSGELIYRMTESHVFDRDRQAIRNRMAYASHSQIIEWLKAELITRKAAEKATPTNA